MLTVELYVDPLWLRINATVPGSLFHAFLYDISITHTSHGYSLESAE